MRYEKIAAISQEAAEKALMSGSTQEAARAVIRVAMCEDDEAWAEHFCMRALKDRRAEVRVSAITGVGHLARRYKRVHPALVAELRSLETDTKFAGAVEDAL